MRAIHITTLDGPEAIEVVDLPDPSDEGMVTIIMLLRLQSAANMDQIFNRISNES